MSPSDGKRHQRHAGSIHCATRGGSIDAAVPVASRGLRLRAVGHVDQREGGGRTSHRRSHKRVAALPTAVNDRGVNARCSGRVAPRRTARRIAACLDACPFAQSPTCDGHVRRVRGESVYMNLAPRACGRSRFLGDRGQCDRNPSYMNVTCASACALERTRAEKDRAEEEARATLIRASCSRWADDGECSANAAFMAGECAADCVAWRGAEYARRGVRCAHRVRAVKLDAAVRPQGDWPARAAGHPQRRRSANQLFWLDRGLNSTERPFSVVMPRSRYTQPTFVGHFSSCACSRRAASRPPRDECCATCTPAYFGVGRCDRERHARRAADAAPADDDGDDAAEPPAAAVLSSRCATCSRRRWPPPTAADLSVLRRAASPAATARTCCSTATPPTARGPARCLGAAPATAGCSCSTSSATLSSTTGSVSRRRGRRRRVGSGGGGRGGGAREARAAARARRAAPAE